MVRSSHYRISRSDLDNLHNRIRTSEQRRMQDRRDFENRLNEERERFSQTERNHERYHVQGKLGLKL